MGGRQALLQAGNQQLRQSLRADRRVVPPGPSARGHPRPCPCIPQSAPTFLSSRWASSNVKLWEFYRETQRFREYRCAGAGPRLRGWGPEVGCHSEQEPHPITPVPGRRAPALPAAMPRGLSDPPHHAPSRNQEPAGGHARAPPCPTASSRVPGPRRPLTSRLYVRRACIITSSGPVCTASATAPGSMAPVALGAGQAGGAALRGSSWPDSTCPARG